MSSNDDYVEPPVVFGKWTWLFVILSIIFLYFEIKYMYMWCKWFTNCW